MQDSNPPHSYPPIFQPNISNRTGSLKSEILCGVGFRGCKKKKSCQDLWITGLVCVVIEEIGHGNWLHNGAFPNIKFIHTYTKILFTRSLFLP